MEIFDIVDEKGIPTGETIERTQAHEKGVRHRTAHIWIDERNAVQSQSFFGIYWYSGKKPWRLLSNAVSQRCLP